MISVELALDTLSSAAERGDAARELVLTRLTRQSKLADDSLVNQCVTSRI